MKQKSQKVLKLLTDEDQLAEERSKALKISKEIQGFGNLIVSPSASTPSSSSSRTSRASSFSSYSCDSPSWSRQDEQNIKPLNKTFEQESTQHGSPKMPAKGVEKLHLWDSPIEENGYLIDQTKREDPEENSYSPSSSSKGYYTRLFNNSYQSARDRAAAFRSLSDVGKGIKKKIDRQLSLGFWSLFCILGCIWVVHNMNAMHHVTKETYRYVMS